MRACSPPTRRSSSARNTAIRRCSTHHTTSLVFNDPPLHTHVRRAIQMALSNRVIAGMEAGLVALVDRLLDAMAAKGRADLIEDFAAAIPVEIIGNLLGVPHRRSRSAARLVARDPGRARAGADAGADGARQRRGARLFRLSAWPGRGSPPASGRCREGSADAPDCRRARRPQIDRDRAVAELHLHPQRRPRDHDEPDRQCARALHPFSRRAPAADRKPRPDEERGRGGAALRKLEPARQSHRDRGHRHRRRPRCRRERW